MTTLDERFKIAFLTAHDPMDRRPWSGTIYHIGQTLQRQCGDVTFIGPIPARRKLVGKVAHKTSQALFKRNYAYNHTFALAKHYASYTEKKLAQQPFDAIVAVAGATEIACLRTHIPIILIEDATFALLENYHQHFSSLLRFSAREVDALEALAIKQARFALYPSQWAAQSAVDYYHAQPEKVRVVPFGANFEQNPTSDIANHRQKSDHCRLLFIGTNWERKGGPIAYETLLKLEEMGIQATLTICGSVPPAHISHERMKVIPFLDKNDEQQRKTLEQLYIDADFLLFPTRNDCYGIVVCEASAYGLPVLASDTGGVPGVVREGENGFLLPYEADGTAYAKLIAAVYGDDQRYMELVRSSRATFDTLLNWDAWGNSVKSLIAEMVGREDTQASDEIPAVSSR
ncbi:MAG: glycosyltransferase family 4 protein [Ktedonobacteraceae bacterium]